MLQKFAKEFVAEGGRQAFGITGSGPSLSLIDQLEKSGVEFITTGHESTAALMAGAAARLGGNPALAITIKGPGFMNMLPGLLCNAYEGFPSLSVSESYPQGTPGSRCHKWLDHGRAGGEFLKQHLHYQADRVSLKDCWNTARKEFPGPVHLDLGSGERLVEELAQEFETTGISPLQQRIAASRRPLLIVGSLGLRRSWRAALQRLRIPLFTSAAGKGLIDENTPFAAGVYTGAGKADTPEKRLLPDADLLITLGLRSGEILNPAFDPECTLHLDTIAPRAGSLYPPSPLAGKTETLSDNQIAEVIGLLADKQWGEERIQASRQRLVEIAAAYGWSPVAAMGQVQAMVPEAIHVLDTGNFTVIGEHFIRARSPSGLIGTPNGRYMGAALGYALGACVALPESPVVLWIGDGGIRSLIGELALAAEQRLKLLVLVMKDGSFGSIRGSALNSGLTQRPVTLSQRSMSTIADALGLSSGVIENGAQLEAAVKEWRENPQPSLYECKLDPTPYIELTAKLR